MMHVIPAPGQYDSRKLVRMFDNDISALLTYYRGQWAGPIEPPA